MSGRASVREVVPQKYFLTGKTRVRHDDRLDAQQRVHAVQPMTAEKRSANSIRRERRRTTHACWEHLIVAPLWAAYTDNIGTLARTCDAVGACLALHVHRQAGLRKGNTLGRGQPHMHWANTARGWIAKERARDDTRVVAVELAEGATRLADVLPARQRTIILLGNEGRGIPDDVWDLIDEVIEIPMVGLGGSLNVAVAGSLAVYKLAGLT